MGDARANGLRGDDTLTFQHGVELVGMQVGECFGCAGWPADFDCFYLGRVSQTEVDPQIALR